jgi:hypothetical protein
MSQTEHKSKAIDYYFKYFILNKVINLGFFFSFLHSFIRIRISGYVNYKHTHTHGQKQNSAFFSKEKKKKKRKHHSFNVG